jgi:D-sedoheptulose 7-phosphate isomerase
MSDATNADAAQYLRASIAVKQAMLGDEALLRRIGEIAGAIASALAQGNKLVLAGNGGSAADAQHIASEFVGQFSGDRPGIAAVALTTDTSVLTSVANDYGFEQVFSRQVATLGRSGDVLLAISTSGNSANIVAAVEAARDSGMFTVALTGASGGQVRRLCDLCLRVPSDDTPRIQEAHILVGHMLCALVERRLYPA